MKSYVEIILSVKLARLNYISLPGESKKYFTYSPLFGRHGAMVVFGCTAYVQPDSIRMLKALYGLRP